ncbi:MAG: prepilin-type N-terminal cleavage/methylation domain-containing protein [Clostridia bacterium]|nr:prepilin-type N-terminal cleavage/methylation domain-containing protein [Clostridia bacterium]
MHQKKGFTLAKLLIVVAVIAVLIAIAIPIFTSQLEKSRESTDLANVRSAYAEITTEANSDADGEGIKTYSRSIELKQKKDYWQRPMPITLGGIKSADKTHWKNYPKAGGTCTVLYSSKNGVIIDWDNANFPILTNYMHYLTENKSSIEASESYAGYLVKNPDGTYEINDHLSTSASPSLRPSGAVVYVESRDAKSFIFKNITTNAYTTWSYGDKWDSVVFYTPAP